VSGKCNFQKRKDEEEDEYEVKQHILFVLVLLLVRPLSYS